MHVHVRRWCALASLLLLAGCSSADSTDATTSPDAAGIQMGAGTIGSSGGSITSAGGEVVLQVPPGALDHDVAITMWKISTNIGGAVGRAFEIGPTGTIFAKPVRLSFRYDLATLGGRAPADLRVATLVVDSWDILGGQMLDASASTVSGTTTHLSTYALVFADGGEMDGGSDGATRGSDAGVDDVSIDAPAPQGEAGPPDATSSPDATSLDAVRPDVASPDGAPDSSSSNSSSSDASSSDAASPDATPPDAKDSAIEAGPLCMGEGAGGPLGGPYPTCATSQPCTRSAGYVVASCVDNSTGYSATCCPSPDAAINGSGDSGGGGSGPACQMETAGGTGAPYPICETSQPCSQRPGLVMTSCVNNSTGYTATCCPSADAAVVDSGSSGGSSEGGSTCAADGAIGPPGGPYPRCETSGPCTFYPGLVVMSCVNTSNGYNAMCCPP